MLLVFVGPGHLKREKRDIWKTCTNVFLRKITIDFSLLFVKGSFIHFRKETRPFLIWHAFLFFLHFWKDFRFFLCRLHAPLFLPRVFWLFNMVKLAFCILSEVSFISSAISSRFSTASFSPRFCKLSSKTWILWRDSMHFILNTLLPLSTAATYHCRDLHIL